jgi:hypothetical protein
VSDNRSNSSNAVGSQIADWHSLAAGAALQAELGT